MAEKKFGHEEHMKKADNLGILSGVSRPLKIVFLGAGSGFFKPVFTDIMNIPGAENGTIALVDVDRKRLELSVELGGKIIAAMKRPGWKVIGTTERKEVLEGADYLINCIEVSGTSCVRFDNDIPASYGVDQCIGDTMGAGGLFKALRTVPVFLEVLKDVSRLCPNAWVLNYTNPMSIMCLAAMRAYPKLHVVGLCHSVQGTSHQLADYAQIPYSELIWNCGGVNHLAWFTRLEHKGRDVYEILREKLASDKELLAKDPVRFDMMKYMGYFVTESSGHFSEYLPYYRKRPELIRKHCGAKYLGESSFYANNWPQWRIDSDAKKHDFVSGKEPIDTSRSWEYASFLIEAMETNAPFVAHLTVPNTGLIPNLFADNVVEVPCLVNRKGIFPTYFGKLPGQCAAICASNQSFFNLAADACIEKSKLQAERALMLDPLTAAVCAPEEIRAMTRKLFAAEKAFLKGYK
ncbi:MAG: hypothetical protein PHS41_01240 [Victivallaceae bacterium]|nr:hypothetical protein [Victivallaceae bacterium]